jgi:hypothetical protein
MRARVVAFIAATGLLGLPAAPAAAGSPSCVGQFASHFAQQYGAVFGAEIRAGAQDPQLHPFGAGAVAPYAHEPREACP